MFLQLQDLSRQTHKVVLLFSGGFDSTLVALLLKKASIPTIGLSINYRGRPKSEIEVSRKLISRVGVEEHVEINLPIRDMRLLPGKWLAANAEYEAWFPYRNLIFFSIAAHTAMFRNCNVIASGVRVWDVSTFDDATVSFFSKLHDIIQFCGYSKLSGTIEFFLPLINSHEFAEKALLQGGEMKQILEGTWSCWRDGSKPCGKCEPCLYRASFFAKISQKERGFNDE